jgi:hypothetical protein
MQKNKVGEWIGWTISTLSFLVIIWFFLSWVDIVTHNLDPHPTYQFWNLFVILCRSAAT